MKKILIAEDERPLARALELKLSNAGFAIKTVFDGEEALATLKKESFDLLLLDLVMPKKDGFAVLEALKKKGGIVPVIVLSNLSQEEDAKRAKELGVKDFFIKSDITLAEIIKRVNQALYA